MKSHLVHGAVVLLAGIAAFSSISYLRLSRRLAAYEKAHEAAAARESETVVAPTNATSAASAPSSTNAVKAAEAELKVLSARQMNDTTVRLILSERPDMDGIRKYVSVGPMREGKEGVFGVRYKRGWDWYVGDYVHQLVVEGEFAHRTNVTLRVRRGLPLVGQVGSGKGALAEDFVFDFERPDLKPNADFVAAGRYLPPCGRRTIAIRSVNSPSVRATVNRVAPQNIVQLLAREERVYGAYYGYSTDSDDMLELAGEPQTLTFRCENAANTPETWNVPVGIDDGGSANGVFLVGACVGEGREERRNYRLVCVSDLGLSVRRSGKDEVGVWVTSLTHGRPVAGARVEVRSSANIVIMEGVTDASGWCRVHRLAVEDLLVAGEPFAVIVRSASGDDLTFMALSRRMYVDETYSDGDRDCYLRPNELAGFLWTERGIYRHEERVFAHLIVRNGRMRSPDPLPVQFRLYNPQGNLVASETVMTDKTGAAAYDGFAVPADQPSGTWRLAAVISGENDLMLDVREIRIEEFVPPQIRVTATAAAGSSPTNFVFDVASEHLFGGASAFLRCEGAAVFADVPFAPEAWKGYTFGNADRALRPNLIRLDTVSLDAAGKTRFSVPLPEDLGRPAAAVRATGQGVVFEDGGRPASARASSILHYYPYYIGSTLPEWLRLPEGGAPKIAIACVAPDGRRLAEAKRLTAKLERVDCVYAYREASDGSSMWDGDSVRVPVAEKLELTTSVDADTVFELPVSACGDYVLTVEDPATGVSFSRGFYLSDWGSDEITAPLAKPTKIELVCDKPFYRVGETPRLVVKSPFAGSMLVTALRERERYTEVYALDAPTSELVLRPVTDADAPNLDVYVTVVQGVAGNAKHLAACAHGQTTVCVRPIERELAVGVDATVAHRGPSRRAKDEGGSTVRVKVSLDGEAEAIPENAVAVVTVVDEGINILTSEPTPNPIASFAVPRTSDHPLYDLFARILPNSDEDLRASGVKTGGGFGAELLGRVSPIGSRRFKPLAQWKTEVPVVKGRGEAVFELPEFVGEVRVTAVVYTSGATGAASILRKVTPKVFASPDAPRFVAPGDSFAYTFPIHNRSGADGEVNYIALTNGVHVMTGDVMLADGASTNLVGLAVAPSEPGELALTFCVRGFNEAHEQTILLPVRPPVAWVESCGVTPEKDWRQPTEGRWSSRVYDSPLGEYEAALHWLADYPHGCLEQTASRIFPLVAAGGVFNSVVTNGEDFVEAGVRRVESMLRQNDFVMWPDCSYAPWDREVSVYAVDFLASAERAGVELNVQTALRVLTFLKRWAFDADAETSAYAVMVLAEAGHAEKDRMFRLYDDRSKLSPLARARLSLAFSAIDDRVRAEALLKDSFEPQSVKEAAFALMALVELDPADSRVMPLVLWLNSCRDRGKFSWGTTMENALALRALGVWFNADPSDEGERFVAWRRLTLPQVDEVKDESEGIDISRRFFTRDGRPADLANLHAGDLLVVELSVTSAVTRVVNDLVIEDLFAGAYEPVRSELVVPPLAEQDAKPRVADWVMRHDARDDRMLVFSKRFTLEAGHEAKFAYQVRVVSAGDYVLPGPSVEGMYNPRLHARRAPGRAVVHP